MEENNVEKIEEVKVEKAEKNWLTTLLLCWFLGFLGIHRLYAGKLGSGALIAYGTVCAALILSINTVWGLMAFTAVGAVVVDDFLLICTKHFKDCYGRDIVREK